MKTRNPLIQSAIIVAFCCSTFLLAAETSWWRPIVKAQSIDTLSLCHQPSIFPNIVATCDPTGSRINGGPTEGYSVVHNSIMLIDEGNSVLVIKSPTIYHLHGASEIRAFNGHAFRYLKSTLNGKAIKEHESDLLIIKLIPGKESKISETTYFSTVYPEKK